MNQLPPELKGRKVSDVFMEYVEPYLADFLMDTGTEKHEFEKISEILKFPWMIWNALVNEEYQQKPLKLLQREIKRMPRAVRERLNGMIDRKKTLYADYKYMIGDYSLYEDLKTGEIRMQVEARLVSPST